MRTFYQVYGALRRKNIRNYGLLAICNLISVLLITSFSVVMESNTVQTLLPPGGDSRKQMTMIFSLAVLGCAVFTLYASGLFFRAKSREIGVYMALGTRKSRLSQLLYGDLALISVVSAVVGMALGTPLAIGIWQLFRLLIGSSEMAFSLNPTAYLWPLGFALFIVVTLFFMGWRFIRGSNIMDIIHQQRKSEPVRDVKGWYGIVGILLIAVGISAAAVAPGIAASLGFLPPAWLGLLYVVAALGLYMLLLFLVVRGFGGKRGRYKNIISRSIMKFQGRQTVLNMCVIAVLILAGYFAMFYTPMQLGSAFVRFQNRETDFAFHHRVDEAGIPNRESIEQMANEESVTMRDYQEFSFANLATDGYDREETADGRFGNDYRDFFEEESFLSERDFQLISGMDVDVQTGKYIFITEADYTHNHFDYIEDMKCFTNPDTMQTLPVSFQEEIHYNMLHRFILLDDEDYISITEGLGDEWRETWVQFDVEDGDSSYEFAKRLRNTIINASGEASAVFKNYDRVVRMNTEAAGREYHYEQADYGERDSSNFYLYWRYIPLFRAMDQNDYVMNLAVYLLLFIFISIICISAVIVIAYTRCLTIAEQNRQVYDDLRHLGAKRDYLYRSIKSQVNGVFTLPIAVGTALICAYQVLVLYANSGGFETGDLITFGMDAVLLAVISLLLWAVYRITLKKVSSILNIHAVK